MRRVFLESPYAGDVARNVDYARRAMFDCLKRGEAPFASHLLYTQALDDLDSAQRDLGIKAGCAFRGSCDASVFYMDHGMSTGMAYGLNDAHDIGHPVEFRYLDEEAGK